MSAITQIDETTDIQELSLEATGKIRHVLGLSTLSQADLKRLSAALSIAAAEELTHNSSFATRLKLLFEDLKPPKKQTNKGTNSLARIIEDDLIPVTTGINYEFNPMAPPDPYFLLKLYGPTQLRKALSRYNATRLREISQRLISEKRLTAKPKSKATKEELVEYIASHVIG